MSNMTITGVHAEVILNSRGTETISVTVQAGEHTGTFSVPDGASTGSREVHTKKAPEAVEIVSTRIAPALIGMDATNQLGVDALLHQLDPSPLFDGIGGNVALGVSIAVCKVASQVEGIPLWKYIENLFAQAPQKPAPRLFVNLINGGKHAVYGSPIQEHQIIPDTDDVALAYHIVSKVQQELETLLIEKYGQEHIGKGDEGGFMVPTTSVFEPFELLEEAISKTSFEVPVYMGADIAASSFYENGVYTMDDTSLDTDALLSFYRELHTRFPRLKMVEDPFFESDIDAYARYRKEHSEVLVIGDDLTTTNVKSLEEALAGDALGGIIIKPNQIGTLTDTFATMTLAYVHNISCIVSHRSGETEDDFIADLAFGTKSFGLKAGAPLAKEREAKYQRLIQIEKTNHA